MLKAAYGLSLTRGKLHFAAHSHHPRPDVTRDATMQCWDDAARMLDRKWEHIFNVVIPKAQLNVSDFLSLNYPQQIAFASNTHEFVARILSAFNPQKSLRILTTTNEFLSFARQVKRMEERDNVVVTRVPVHPYESFVPRFKKTLTESTYDLVFLSHVFFDSGYHIPYLEGIVNSVPDKNTVIVIDGYHAFCAIPTSLCAIQNQIFYIAGGYKYAQYGEGACFMSVPRGCTLRPENTGWFAEFGPYEEINKHPEVAYSDDGYRFWGATFDPAGLYRLNAVASWMCEHSLTIEEIHTHVVGLQEYFLECVARRELRQFHQSNLLTPSDSAERGHFLSYVCKDSDEAARVKQQLHRLNVVVDTRGVLLRVGFGIYHDRNDVDALVECMHRVECIDKEWRTA